MLNILFNYLCFSQNTFPSGSLQIFSSLQDCLMISVDPGHLPLCRNIKSYVLYFFGIKVNIISLSSLFCTHYYSFFLLILTEMKLRASYESLKIKQSQSTFSSLFQVLLSLSLSPNLTSFPSYSSFIRHRHPRTFFTDTLGLPETWGFFQTNLSCHLVSTYYVPGTQ